MAHNLAKALFSDSQLSRHGSATAIRCEGRALSYRELAALTRSAAATLAEAGGRPGDRIVFKARDTERLLAGILGAMHAGRVPVILSPRMTADDAVYAIRESEAVLIVADESNAVTGAPVPCLDISSLTAKRERQAPAAAGVDAGNADAAFWLYSSGTTGRMKAVVHGHRDLAPVLDFHQDQLGLAPGRRSFCTSRISFAYAMSNAFLAPLALGAELILHPDWPLPESCLEAIRDADPHVVFSVPSMYRAWLDLPELDLPELDLPEKALAPMQRVEHFVSAGEHLPVPIAERWHEVTGRRILDCHGTSETCFLIFASSPARPKPGSVGKPCPGVETALRDDEDRPVAQGRAGRLFIRHPYLAIGYGPAAGPEAQARFSNGWFATGDVFRCDEDGDWFHYGREDDWLKIAGQWVSLHGVEEAAAECADVGEAVGVTATDGRGFLRVALFVVPAAEADLDRFLARVEAFLHSRLPAFKRPKWIRAVEELPRTSTGKVRKAELRRMIEDAAA